ncbi:MAG: UvrD-helicase domain-containing protein, partial [Acidimicrobiales bacterium]
GIWGFSGGAPPWSWAAHGLEERLLADLNPAQRQAVTTDAAPLCILAGAGSGKTRVLTRRIAWRIAQGRADPRHVLAITFTRKAAGELRARLATMGVRDGVAASTFHAIAYAQLRRRWSDQGRVPPAILERKARLLVPLLPRQGAASALQIADVASEIEWAKARRVPPDAYEDAVAAAGRKSPLPPGQIAALFSRYEAEKRRRGLVDFDDLLAACADAMETDPEFAAGQRWRFRHFFVDEFQDVNPAQLHLLDLWRHDRLDLCVVGDPNQAIYSWNGADAGYLVGFKDHFPGASVVRLEDNYRSSPQILAVAHAVLGGGPRATRPLRSNSPDGPAPTSTRHPTDRDEARDVARALRDHHGPQTPWCHLAVLTRTNAQLLLFEEALRAGGIPHRVRGGGFLDQPEVRAALADMRRLPPGIPLSSALADLLELAGAGTDGADGGGADGGGAAPLDGPAAERRRQLEGLLRLAQEHSAADPAATVSGFLSWLAATVRGDEPDTGGDVVTLSTFHGSKGLEWPVVFLPGMERGLVPIGHADTTEARAVERRLLHVAVTRARCELHCSWAERRTFGTRTSTRSPSPYLEVVEAVAKALEAGEVDWHRFLEDNRASLRAARDAAQGRGRSRRNGPGIEVGRQADPAVYDALKAWRAAAARASGVPAFVIFHDTTLAAVAEAKPRDRSSLLALPGMGPVKVERYGEEMLAVVARSATSPAPAHRAG